MGPIMILDVRIRDGRPPANCDLHDFEIVMSGDDSTNSRTLQPKPIVPTIRMRIDSALISRVTTLVFLGLSACGASEMADLRQFVEDKTERPAV